MPIVPAGFTVTTYAELQAPRMMVYAPNGDLFVSSPAANTIVVLRDANNDGTFEACSVFAAGVLREQVAADAVARCHRQRFPPDAPDR